MVESQPNDYWTAISSQNRWHGAIFAGNLNSTLYTRCEPNGSTYNQHWAVQNKGTLITQKLRHAVNAGAMRVCFSEDLERHEEGGWFFAQAPQAFAAVKVVSGGWQWDDELWLRCEEEYTPVIIEVVRSQDYGGDFAAFKQDVFGQDVHFEEGVLRYSGLQGSGDSTFYAESERTPEVNGEPIDFAPDFAFKSPFLNEDWASGLVYITKGDRELVIDVREGQNAKATRSSKG